MFAFDKKELFKSITHKDVFICSSYQITIFIELLPINAVGCVF